MKIIKKLTEKHFDDMASKTESNHFHGNPIVVHNPFDGEILGAKRPDLGAIVVSAYDLTVEGMTEKLAVYKPNIHIVVSLHKLCQTCPFSVQISDDEVINLADYLESLHGWSKQHFDYEVRSVESSGQIMAWVYTNLLKYLNTINPSSIGFMRANCWLYTAGKMPTDFYAQFTRIYKPTRFYICGGAVVPLRGQDEQFLIPKGWRLVSASMESVKKSIVKSYRSILNG